MSTFPVRSTTVSTADTFMEHLVRWPAGNFFPTVIVGVSGTPSSLSAVQIAAAMAGSDGRIILTTAIRNTCDSSSWTREKREWADSLGPDAYLLEAQSEILKIQRIARETARLSGSLFIQEVVRTGSPFRVLHSVFTELAADAIVLGGQNRTSQLARKLSRSASVNALVVSCASCVTDMQALNKENRSWRRLRQRKPSVNHLDGCEYRNFRKLSPS